MILLFHAPAILKVAEMQSITHFLVRKTVQWNVHICIVQLNTPLPPPHQPF